jgi:hypothetical protein
MEVIKLGNDKIMIFKGLLFLESSGGVREQEQKEEKQVAGFYRNWNSQPTSQS